MECSICSTSFSSRGQPTCASCARAFLYQARLNHLIDLVAKEGCERDVSTVIKPPSQIPAESLTARFELADGAIKQQHVRILNEIDAVQDRHVRIEHQIKRLKHQIEEARTERESRKSALEKSRSELASQMEQFDSRCPQVLGPLQANIKHLHRKLDKIHFRTREGRVKLCQETARLAGLRQRRQKTSGGQVIEEYSIGGVQIPDLRRLHTARPEQITAALANTCRLLSTTCHYLSVRLPAEITQAHANYPHPTIFSIQSSYQGFTLQFPGSAIAPPASSSGGSPTNSQLLEHRSLPKLRLLHLDKPLIRLAREDTTSYKLFVEGVALLAWDVAWLCRTQGLSSVNSWDEVCNLGKNLCLLFRSHAAASDQRAAQRAAGPDRASSLVAPTAFGEMSHAGIVGNIEGPAGIAVMRSWRLSSPHRVIDKLKSHLLAEMSGAEWELIAESEWDVEREDERAVMVGGIRPGDVDDSGAAVRSDESKAVSGWTKLKSRGTDAIL